MMCLLLRRYKPVVSDSYVCVCTFATMSRCPWLAARCNGVSSPRFITLIRAPRMMSMSTTPPRPSLHAQWRGLKPWSSLKRKTRTEHEEREEDAFLKDER
ncbi:hypothetical protein EYF80_010688 [Liparis tanakae]|uniref:Uncharacterized protein n=1 Tax=Liparis tanakae TaxID=230148 RepID=A0A4Z2ILV2_9TELE|nr:hypothetical protein EYF80_010688 [Liparis tanakae]